MIKILISKKLRQLKWETPLAPVVNQISNNIFNTFWYTYPQATTRRRESHVI